MKINLHHLLILMVPLFFVSCDPNRIFEMNAYIDPNGWAAGDAAEFSFEIQDTINPHNFYINVRHSTAYKYSNLFLFVNTTFPGGSTTRDTLEILLADSKGEWFGKGLGNTKENQVLIQHGFVFPTAGAYLFNIEQGMRDESLKGIEDVGIRIERTTQ